MRLSRRDRWVWGAGLLSAALSGGVLLWLLVAALRVAGQGWGHSGILWDGSLLPAVVGTVWLVLIGFLVSAPVAIAAAIYLEELEPPASVAALMRANAAALATVPSVVWGLFGAVVWVRTVGFGHSVIAGGLSLAALMLPVELIAARDGLRAVPSGVREAALALGASQWRALWQVVVPTALPRIVTGLVLAIARAAGEAAPLLMVGALAYAGFVPIDPSGGYTALPVQIFSWLLRPDGTWSAQAATGALLLLVVTLGMSSFAVWTRARRQRRIAE
ncbi:MAG: ABC transporter permease subunit [Myxococcota bacterium]